MSIFCLFIPINATKPVNAQEGNSPPAIAPSSVAWHSDQATCLIGLSEVKPRTKGSLSISPTALTFTTPSGHTSIDRVTILTVTTGGERIEEGGTAGRITRAVIPFGGGAAVATVTKKQVDVLTIEFRDQRNALHGAVFLLPKDEAAQARQQLGSQIARAEMEPSRIFCKAGEITHPGTIRVASIATLGGSVPAEYRVLLYEQILSRLRDEGTFGGTYRDGDTSLAAACPQYTFALTLDTFKKGNAVLRASTGPVGYFVGATSLSFHVSVQDHGGKMLLDKEFKASERGDTESLGVADKIAKSLTKKLKKARERAA